MPAARRLPARRLLLGLLLLAVVLLPGRLAGGHLLEFAARLHGLGAWGPLGFIAVYAAATIAFVPGLILTLAAGALFGLGRGACYALTGATLGACGAFLVARYVARSTIERWLEGRFRLAAIDRAIAARGWTIVLLLRLSPVVPFNLLNYALGLTRVRFADYLLASIGMVPGTLLYVYYGRLLGDVAALAGGAAVKRDTTGYLVLALGLAATLAATVMVTRIARRALSVPLPEPPPPVGVGTRSAARDGAGTRSAGGPAPTGGP